MNVTKKDYITSEYEKVSKRCNQLVELDMQFDFVSGYIGSTEINKDFNVHQTEISLDDDETWDRKVEDLKNELKRRQDAN